MLEVLLMGQNGFGIQIDYVQQANTPPIENVRWINVVTHDPYENPLNNVTRSYVDPVLCGAWEWQPNTDCSPYYYDNADHEGTRARHRVDHYKNHPADNKFRFVDLPNDHRLNKTDAIKFRTCLVDITENDKELACVSWDINRPSGKKQQDNTITIVNTEEKTMDIHVNPTNLIIVRRSGEVEEKDLITYWVDVLKTACISAALFTWLVYKSK